MIGNQSARGAGPSIGAPPHRTRNCLPLVLWAAILALLPALPSHATEGDEPFSPEKEKAVRGAVYDGRMMLGSDSDFHSKLLVSDDLVALYEKHPQPVLDVLLKIIDGGRPRDSALAAGFAISLLQNPYVGTVCINTFKKDTYDTVDKYWKTTPRIHWIKQVQFLAKKRARK